MKKIIILLIVLVVLALLSGCQDKPAYQYTTGAGGEGTALTIDCTAEIAQWDIIEIKFPLGRTDTFYFNDFCDDME